MARQLSLAQLPKRGRPPRHQYVNRLAASQSSQRGTSRRGQPPLLCTGSRHSAISQYTARRFLWYKMTVLARIYGVLRTAPRNHPKYLLFSQNRHFAYPMSRQQRVLSWKMIACHHYEVHRLGVRTAFSGSLRGLAGVVARDT